MDEEKKEYRGEEQEEKKEGDTLINIKSTEPFPEFDSSMKPTDDQIKCFLLAVKAGKAKKFPEAFAGFLKAARGNHAGALFNAGVCLQNGTGCLRNPEIAAFMYKRAGRLGHLKAWHFLGLMYKNGEGVPQDDDEALKCFYLAQEQNPTLQVGTVMRTLESCKCM